MSQTVKFNRGQNTRKNIFHKFVGKRQDNLQDTKMRAEVDGHRLSLVSRVSVLLVSTRWRENVRLCRIDSNTSYVIKEVKINTVLDIHKDTFVHDGTCLHGYARSRVGYGT